VFLNLGHHCWADGLKENGGLNKLNYKPDFLLMKPLFFDSNQSQLVAKFLLLIEGKRVVN